ncbi:hypothetical protein [Streptomyces sp. NPDC005385]|uniref:phage scaffolding protein n=1 Tax=Streptomyces sp. NPDC005385 TaxID=3157039 RepID=UPI0033AC18C0
MTDMISPESGVEDLAYNDTADTIDDDTQDEWVPPTREEHDKLVADMKKATAESVKRKKMLRENGIDLATGKRADASDTASDDGDQVSRADYDTAISQVKARTTSLLFEVPTALSEAGWNGNKRLLRHLDLDAVEIDEDGITGLTEQIEELKGEFPEFFKRTRTNTAPAGAVGAGKKQTESSGSGHWADQFRKSIYGGN